MMSVVFFITGLGSSVIILTFELGESRFLRVDDDEATSAFSTVSLGIMTFLPFLLPAVVLGRAPFVATDLNSCC